MEVYPRVSEGEIKTDRPSSVTHLQQANNRKICP